MWTGIAESNPQDEQELVKCAVEAAVAAMRMFLSSFKWEMGNWVKDESRRDGRHGGLTG